MGEGPERVDFVLVLDAVVHAGSAISSTVSAVIVHQLGLSGAYLGIYINESTFSKSAIVLFRELNILPEQYPTMTSLISQQERRLSFVH